MTREQLHDLLDALPESRLPEAEAGLKPLLVPDYPEDDEPLTEEDLVALAEFRAERAQGQTVSHADVRREMGW